MLPLKIIVTGSNGQLGSELKALAQLYPQYEFFFFSREDFPITDAAITEKLFEQLRPQFLINCAAYTAVDKAESEMKIAGEINGTSVGRLAGTCRRFKARLIHISTDYVFNGKQKQPLKETDRVEPINMYGETKLMGEQLALKNHPDSIILRTSWVYSFYGKNFVKTMMRLMQEKESISVINDQWGSPTYAADLAAAIMEIIDHGKWVPGIYHYSNDGVITWFDFASEIKAMIASSCEVNPIATASYPTPAKRPQYSVMDKTKILETYPFITLRDWKKSLRICIDKINSH